jgi:hypothetical protein
VNKTKLNTVAVVRKRTIPTERPPLIGEVNAGRDKEAVLFQNFPGEDEESHEKSCG